MPFLLAEILNFQGSTHHIGVGSFSYLLFLIPFPDHQAELKKHFGREDNGMEMKLHTKAEYKEKTAKASAEKTAASDNGEINAKLIVEALGGPDNIEKSR